MNKIKVNMNDVRIFATPEFGKVRTFEIDGEPYFVGKDVAEILGYKDTSDALKKHVDNEDKLTRRFADSGQNRDMYIINESGLYSLVLSSKLPKAKSFKRWITYEVIPAIRKAGSYTVNSSRTSFDDYIKACGIVAEILRISESGKIRMVESAFKNYGLPVPELPKYDYNDIHGIARSATELLRKNGIKMSAMVFNRFLLASGYICDMERTNSKGNVKKFKSVTEKGLKYGKNVPNPRNEHETQALWYEDTFSELLYILGIENS